jgi:hypothetical protein
VTWWNTIAKLQKVPPLHLHGVALVRESCLHNQFHLFKLVEVGPDFDFANCHRLILLVPFAISEIYSFSIQRILLLLACSLMTPHTQSRGRNRRRGRKEEEEGASGGDDLGAHEPQHDGTHRQGDNVREPGAPFLFSLNLNSVFYLCELGSQIGMRL